jgi:sialidase-1
LIEADPTGWYCYTAIHFIDQGFLLAYCAGYPGHGLDRLRIRRISLSWLGQAPPPPDHP